MLGGTVHYRVPILITEWTVKDFVTVTKTCVMFLWDVLFLPQVNILIDKQILKVFRLSHDVIESIPD